MRQKIVRWVRSQPLARRALGIAEAAVFGTRLREQTARFVLRQYYESRFRRTWAWWCYGEPHFSDHAQTFFRLYDGSSGEAVYSLARAMYAAQVIREGDSVLDIGCGEGGYTKRFLAPRAAHVDAMDVETSAVRSAQRGAAAPNISYILADAVATPFPRPAYNVIVLDGMLGHLSVDHGQQLLQKISSALEPQGVFCGSESLGAEGHDHLQQFRDPEALRAQLARHFPCVQIKTARYRINAAGYVRTEAYWRCAQSTSPLEALRWG